MYIKVRQNSSCRTVIRKYIFYFYICIRRLYNGEKHYVSYTHENATSKNIRKLQISINKEETTIFYITHSSKTNYISSHKGFYTSEDASKRYDYPHVKQWAKNQHKGCDH